MSDRNLHAPSVVTAVLLVGALMNVAQHPVIEREMSDWYEAVRIKPDHDLRALSEAHFGSTQSRFNLYLQLRDLAPGATVELSPSSALVGEHLLGLSEAAAVVRRDTEAAVDAAVAATLAPFVVAAGEDRDAGAYAIALRDGDSTDRVIVVTGPERTWLVGADLLADARGGAA